MKISHIEHLGIAVKSIEEALPYYENVLGLKCYNIETVEDQKVSQVRQLFPVWVSFTWILSSTV